MINQINWEDKKMEEFAKVEKLVEITGASFEDARNALDLCFDLIEKALLEGQEVNITNFGVFTPKTRQSRDGTHPKQHTRIKIAESRSVTFRLSKALKGKLNK